MKTFHEVCAVIVIILCIIALLFCSVIFFTSNTPKKNIKHEITFSLNSDSTKTNIQEIHLIVDSLNTYLKTTEQRIADKYEYFLEQKKEENLLFSIGSVSLGIFVSILGFFGYKSFKDIENNAKEHAQFIASKTAEEHLKNNMPMYLDTRLGSIVINLKDTIKLIVNEQINDKIRHDINNIEENIEILNMYVNESICPNGNTPNPQNNSNKKSLNTSINKSKPLNNPSNGNDLFGDNYN